MNTPWLSQPFIGKIAEKRVMEFGYGTDTLGRHE